MAQVYDLNAALAEEWVRLDDNSPVPARARVLASLDRLHNDGDALKNQALALGVYLAPDAEVESIAAELEFLALVELEFPSFADGRAFSQARELRERFGYRGDIRATGEVLRDQVDFMRRCGFNQFDLSRDELAPPPAELPGFRQVYQPDRSRAADDAARPATKAVEV